MACIVSCESFHDAKDTAGGSSKTHKDQFEGHTGMHPIGSAGRSLLRSCQGSSKTCPWEPWKGSLRFGVSGGNRLSKNEATCCRYQL